LCVSPKKRSVNGSISTVSPPCTTSTSMPEAAAASATPWGPSTRASGFASISSDTRSAEKWSACSWVSTIATTPEVSGRVARNMPGSITSRAVPLLTTMQECSYFVTFMVPTLCL